MSVDAIPHVLDLQGAPPQSLPVRAGRPPGTGAGVGPAGPAGRRPRTAAPRSRRTSVVAMTAAFVTLFLEVEAGARPRAQLRPLMTAMLYARLSEIWVRGGEPGRVVTVRAIASGQEDWDLVAVVRRGTRWGAIGINLVRSDERWVVAAVARPEDRELPPPPYPVPAPDPDDDDDQLPPVALRAPGPPEVDWFPAAQSG